MTAEIYVPESCTAVLSVAGEPQWHVRLIKPDGTGMRIEIAASAPHWRCAEYGLDIADPPTVWHTILHEVFIHHTDPHAHLSPYSMPAAQAWELHQVRIAHARTRVTVDHQHAAFAAFYAGHGLTAESVGWFADHVAQVRERHTRSAERSARLPGIVDGRPIITPPRAHGPRAARTEGDRP